MNLVKLEIDGKKIIADSRSTILEVAREHGIHDIPTLCHDDQLEPFASCFVCVVKVKGARTLLPACSTRVAAGMVVETDNAEVRRSRKAALELLLSNHYADCIGPCQLACPAGIDIQGYIALAALGKYNDAIRLIKEKNPLPAVCGRVCTRPCEVKGCRRNLVDEAVGIDYIKRYLADVDLGRREPFKPAVAPPNGKRVAIVGGGPAGLSCAYYLATLGYDVHVLEGLPEAGGMLRYGIPEYRLPKSILDLEINQILDLGVTLRTNVVLGRDFTVAGLRQQGFDAVFLGIGAWDSSKMRIQDEDTPGVLRGIDFLKQFGLRRAEKLTGRVLVVGGGNTAIDCARTALRMGADDVRLLYRRTRAEMPANEMEIVEAEHEGVAMEFLVAPVRVVRKDGRVAGLECLRMELGEPDASGRRSPKPVRGSEFVVEGGTVLAAIGQGTQVQDLVSGKIPNFLPFGETLNLTRWQTIQVEEGTFETSVEGVFSGGDVVTGAATAIEAIAAGRKAAHAIDAYCTGGKAKPEPPQFVSRKDTFHEVTAEDLRPGSRSSRKPMPVLSKDERAKSFAEVELGYSAGDTRQEAARCLECGCVSLFTCDLRRYATEYGAEIKGFLGEAKRYDLDRSHPLIELDPNKCILCGRCVRTCSELVGVAAYGYVNRGFNTVVRPALGGSLLETGCVTCGLCIGTCPTGAITEKIPLAKPGPWPTEPVQTICHYCGTGCRLDHDVFGSTLVKMSRREDGHATSGAHCARGRFGYDWVQDERRLRLGMIRTGRELQQAPVDDTIAYAAMRLDELRRKHTGDEIAVFVSPRLSNEELYLAQKFARIALGTHQVTSFSRLVNGAWDCPDVLSDATYRDLADAQTVLVVGAEPAENQFVVDLLAKKAQKKGGRLIYVGDAENGTSRFADVVLPCKPGEEPRVLLALLARRTGRETDALEVFPGLADAVRDAVPVDGIDPADLAAADELLAKSILKVMVFDKDRRVALVPGDVRLYADAAAALGCTVLALRETSNMQGLLDMGASPAWLPGYVAVDDGAGIDRLEREWCIALDAVTGAGSDADIARRLARGEIKVAVVLGEDPAGEAGLPRDMLDGLLACEFLLAGDVFLTATVASAHAVLPLSARAETSGTVTNQERRVQRFLRAIPPVAGVETWEILCRLAARMGHRFKMKYRTVDEVTAEIRRVVTLYDGVAIDSPEPDGVWPLSDMPLERVPFAGPVPAATLATPTRALDALEARFDAWFAKVHAEAKAAL